jgi:hypothetical protein
MIGVTIWLEDEDSVRSWKFMREHSFANHSHSASSYMLVCPICNTIWAKHIMADQSLVWPYAQFCECCDVYADRLRPVPGSLLIQHGLDTIDESLLEALPTDLLIREYDLHIKALDNGNLEPRDFSAPRSERADRGADGNG